jgi:hypothetical protein
MKFEERVAIGEHMETKQLEAEVRGLLADPRFNAVLGLVKRNREAYVTAGSAQNLAPHHGAMAHCGGSVHALDGLLAQLKGLIQPPKRRGEKPPPAE